MQIIANKTNLYRLIAEHMFLPKSKYTTFKKISTQNYSLEWISENGCDYRACYLIDNGYPALVINVIGEENDDSTNPSNLIIRWKNVVDLAVRGMLIGVRKNHQQVTQHEEQVSQSVKMRSVLEII